MNANRPASFPYSGIPSEDPLRAPRWEVRASDPEQVQKLADELGISTVTAKVLINRKITTPDAAKNFLNSDLSQIRDPYSLKDMDRAVERVLKAIQNNEKICIYGDYDVDGAVATSMLVLFLGELGADVYYYIPNRLVEGYSLNRGALEGLKTRGTHLIITVDNGIMAHAEIEYANSLGLDIVVTDHHQTAATLPPAVAVVNPQRSDCPYPFKGICGAGVAFKLMMALRQKLRENGFFQNRSEPVLKNYLDLLCIPTVCDVVPLVDENRFFVKEGLKVLARTQRPGLQALTRVCALNGKAPSSYDLGFRFGPRINACGRLVDATLGVKLLISRNAEEAALLAKQLDRLNQERRDIEQNITAQALDVIDKMTSLEGTKGFALYDPSWHIGVIGIVASRIVDRYHRPAFVLARAENGLIKGSGRSVPGVSLIEILRECESCLKIYGGHEAAAGVTLEVENLSRFTSLFNEAVQKRMPGEVVSRKIWIDDELPLEQINRALVDELALLEPYGMGNVKPVFAAHQVAVGDKRVVGENHLKFKITRQNGDSVEAIAFNRSDVFERLGQKTGLLFGIDLNTYNNRETVQLVVKDFY